MHKEAYRPDIKWKKHCDFIKELVDRDRRNCDCGKAMMSDRKFPTEEDIDMMAILAQKAFGQSPWLQAKMDESYAIREHWLKQRNKRKRLKKQKEYETMNKDVTVELDEREAKSITDAITKLAQENDITMADGVVITLSSDDGIITFNGMEKQAVVNPANLDTNDMLTLKSELQNATMEELQILSQDPLPYNKYVYEEIARRRAMGAQENQSMVTTSPQPFVAPIPPEQGPIQ